MSDDRSKNWVGLWYPEDETHYNAMEKLMAGGYRYAAILHDKDVTEDGETKKPHWHVVIVFPNQRTVNPIAKEFGIAPNYLQLSHDRDSALRYLIHADNPEKYRYDEEEVFGSLADSVSQLSNKPSETEQVLSLLSILDRLPVPCTYYQFLVSACNADLYAAFRRMGTGACKLLDEHNQGYDPCSTDKLPNAERMAFDSFVTGYEAGKKDKGGIACY